MLSSRQHHINPGHTVPGRENPTELERKQVSLVTAEPRNMV
jgi:hypothetical protein